MFVFPSSLETFGIVLVESLSFGVSVISSKVGAAEDILDSGRAGILLNETTPEAIVHALNLAESSQMENTKRVRHGITLVKKYHNLEYFFFFYKKNLYKKKLFS